VSNEPTISAEEAERLRRWHESAYAQGRAEGRAGQTFDYLGLTLDVPPDVMPISRVSHLLGQAVLADVRPADRVLDMGTGSGVNAILAARTARSVVAVDINPSAIEAARANARRNGVADRVEVRHGAVFSDVDGEFFAQVRSHLTPAGRMLIFFGTSGDLGYLRSIAGSAGFAAVVIATVHVLRDGVRVDYYTYRMTMVGD
jgi:release factor glutamine methyltransferase